MAYRRKPQPPQTPPSLDHHHHHHTPSVGPSSPPQDSLAAQAMRASAAHRDASSLSSAYSSSSASAAAAAAAARRGHHEPSVSTPSPGSSGYEYTSMKNLNEAKYGFWGALARKAKSFLDEDGSPGQYDSPARQQPSRDAPPVGVQYTRSQQPPSETWKSETPPSHKRSEAIASSLNYIGGTIKSALEEGRTIVENKTADIIHETRKLNIRRKGAGSTTQGEAPQRFTQRNLPQNPLDYETQLKASRDVANAMAAKAKLLLRELKTVKADLAFAKERCAQLEDENKILRESHDKGDNPEDDDLIRLQLETLLAEKARLAHENSVYARENRFLREIVEYHQLTMQDVIYVDEGIEEVTEVYPTQVLPPAPSRAGSGLGRSVTPATPKTASSSPSSTSIVVPETCPVVPASPKSLSRTSSKQ
ncbi:uncharacterized protein [Oryza sativa Japonica Group]|uniref:Os05g0315200 protein n=5 Tax=Oryza TaxID=4527 RepID=Q5WMS9_ORYSJ|nr:uncharacterized protein LOC4338389 [Oryza sativa Japonica Group]KAB8098871.1 hypothetical protein EE612_028589 [Oryza sativa]AAV32154.1 unknown protein [Oryza sativa Japonica Group]AAV32156.1 unknown protein [Oryza sativa Japonica Group]KAF2930154.1 hypothetical protein DAI22_05g111000 [Oryza sativa Japonica Group]BAF17085.1 Os05g0315200 [Oryza sativa Japonica Group]|eukprot:NP_001055171.1 Os05g0315200 [Oryza sativa Japonica Group]